MNLTIYKKCGHVRSLHSANRAGLTIGDALPLGAHLAQRPTASNHDGGRKRDAIAGASSPSMLQRNEAAAFIQGEDAGLAFAGGFAMALDALGPLHAAKLTHQYIILSNLSLSW
jgi:hypothetical protein